MIMIIINIMIIITIITIIIIITIVVVNDGNDNSTRYII